MTASVSTLPCVKKDLVAHLEADLEGVLAEWAPLDDKRNGIKQRKRRAASRIVWTSVLGVGCFLGTSVHLTWWVLSWDIMEPLTYHVGLTVALMGGVYAAVVPKKELSYTSLASQWAQRRERIDTANAIEGGWDPERLVILDEIKGELETRLKKASAELATLEIQEQTEGKEGKA
eukprot:TRINITY_DN60459_c0_g1_i3.p1 TRINITY_DN60459_c0_g1~~TRINITY_DN60459_c0_g1_i3.p1  ORF type:complete len:175 (-),score=39.40 TRINITY_DN60459_c0_g1_i3:294-818(-)